MLRFRSLLLAVLPALLLASAGAAEEAVIARANDNRTPAGTLRNGVLTLRLEIVETVWYPQQEGGPHLPVDAFAEEEKAPQVPGPLLRVPEGTLIHATIRNRLPVPMFVQGLHERPGFGAPLEVAPGGIREVRFTAGTPGTYYYFAGSTPQTIAQLAQITFLTPLDDQFAPFGKEALLSGALIVDPAGAATDDRVFVIGLWMTGLAKGPFREVLTINGKAWPNTERLSYQLGEKVRWRWVNTTVDNHAMHLHGFYYRLNGVGDGERDQAFVEGQQRQTVTQHMAPGSTMSLEWSPVREGRWIFHCHMVAHMVDHLDLNAHPLEQNAPKSKPAEEAAGMGGLVLGINVLPDSATQPMATKPQEDARKLRLLVQSRPPTETLPAGVGYRIQEGEAVPAGAPPVPGPPLVLTRGQPVEITVVSQISEPTAVHWHGIELESYYDGVPVWGGDSRQVTPLIAPGGTFVARFTPPRAGTFIYHTHWHDVVQLTGGLYGPLIVLEPGQKFDPETDRIFMIGRAGPGVQAYPLVLNGTPQPNAVPLKVGKRYRFRFINIAPNDADAVFSLRSEAGPVTWRAVGKDGWELPPTQAVKKSAEQKITVGETYDFEYIPERAGDLQLEVQAPFLKTRLTQTFEVQP
ncbi:MAG: multicopper oxidase domain-containing protein [Terriglobales bacterium]